MSRWIQPISLLLLASSAAAHVPQPDPIVRTLGLPNAAYIANHFDPLNRQDYAALVNYWGHALDGASYTHDPFGLRTNIVRDFGLTTNSVTVGHDTIDEIISWSAKESSGSPRLNEQFGFGFDKAHNLQSRTNGALVQTFNIDRVNEVTNIGRTGTLTVSGAMPAPATIITVGTNAAERYGDLTFAATNQTLISGTNTFTIVAQNAYGTNATNVATSYLPSSLSLAYDNNGNLTNDGTRSFFYSAENQLTNVIGTNVTVAGSWKSEFVYDGLGRRRIERDYKWQGGWVITNETRYIYDGFLLIQERDSNNVVVVTYTRGSDLIGTDEGAGGIGGLLARTDTNGTTFYHADGAGNVTAMIDFQQNVAARYLYNPFGKLTGKWGALADTNAMQFSSMPIHRQSGMNEFAFRFYDSTLQRWTSQDPIGERGGIDLYQFVFNSPLNAIDPDGGEAGFIYRPGGGMENALSRRFNPPSDPVAAARQWVGFTDYSFFNPFDDPKWYLRGIKCNKFVGDCISECPKRPKPLIKDPTSDKMRYPLAREWADPSVNIPGYSPPNSSPQPGDVVTDGNHLGFMDDNGYIEAPTHGPVKFLPFNNPLWNPGIGRTPTK